jgi:hypothetical protein
MRWGRQTLNAWIFGILLLAGTSPAFAEKIELQINVDYPDLFEIVPQGQFGKAYANTFPVLRVYVDGLNIGSYKVDENNRFSIDSQSKEVQLFIQGLMGNKADSNLVLIAGRARSGVVRVKCGPEWNPLYMRYWRCVVE